MRPRDLRGGDRAGLEGSLHVLRGDVAEGVESSGAGCGVDLDAESAAKQSLTAPKSPKSPNGLAGAWAAAGAAVVVVAGAAVVAVASGAAAVSSDGPSDSPVEAAMAKVPPAAIARTATAATARRRRGARTGVGRVSSGPAK